MPNYTYKQYDKTTHSALFNPKLSADSSWYTTFLNTWADAYSFETIIVNLWMEQRKDKLPEDLFDGCDMFQLRANVYLRKWDDGRRQLSRTDMIDEEEAIENMLTTGIF
jgi:hypothetical protein